MNGDEEDADGGEDVAVAVMLAVVAAGGEASNAVLRPHAESAKYVSTGDLRIADECANDARDLLRDLDRLNSDDMVENDNDDDGDEGGEV